MPAFPFKTPLRTHTLSDRADRAEYRALSEWNGFLDRIRMGYAPGATLKIYSDGQMFLHSMQDGGFPLTEEMVAQYARDIDDIIGRLDARNRMSVVHLSDFYEGTLDERLVQLVADHQSLSIPQAKAQKISSGSKEYEQLKSYSEHDLQDLQKMGLLDPAMSRSALRRRAAEMAAESVWLTGAWSNLIAQQEPSAIRASLHPISLHETPFGKEKLSVSFGADRPWFADRVEALGEVTGARISPWRSVFVEDPETGEGGRVKNWVAQKLGATLVLDPQSGRPSHYVLSR